MLLVSCETGGRRVPAQWSKTHVLSDPAHVDSPACDESPVIVNRKRMIACDSTGRYAGRRVADSLGVELIENPYSIQCVDVTRSIHHRELFSSTARQLDEHDRQKLLDRVYWPYRERLRRAIAGGLARCPYVIHLSVRSFAASARGRMHRADVGLVHDASRADEVALCLQWMEQLFDVAPMLRVRRNYPRRGTCDSLHRTMRAEFVSRPYLGVEVALNRAWAGRPLKVRDEAIDGLAVALRAVIRPSQSEAA